MTVVRTLEKWKKWKNVAQFQGNAEECDFLTLECLRMFPCYKKTAQLQLETTLVLLLCVTRLHHLPWRMFFSDRVEYKLTVTFHLWPSRCCQVLCCFAGSGEVKTMLGDAEQPIKTIYSQSFLPLAPFIFQLALCTLTCVHQCCIVSPHSSLIYNYERFFFFWTSSLHFLIIKAQENCSFRGHQLQIENKWAKID